MKSLLLACILALDPLPTEPCARAAELTGMVTAQAEQIAALTDEAKPYCTHAPKGRDCVRRRAVIDELMCQLKELQRSLNTIDYKINHLPRMYREKFSSEAASPGQGK